jgi:hypothetical protein
MAEHFLEEGLAKNMKKRNIKIIMEMVYFNDIFQI